MALDFKHANPVEGVRFTAQVGLPNVVQGLFRRRETVARAAGAVPLDNLAYQLTASLARKYGPDPFYIRVATEEALLVHHPDDIEFVLGGSPTPFASDPEAKKKGMTAFQPDALTISRGDLWANRRAFAEAVLETKSPLHSLAQEFARVATEEADALRALARPVGWSDINGTFQRITRRVVFGDAAVDDTRLTDELSALMDEGNKMPGKPSKGYDEFLAHVAEYVSTPDPKALTGLVAGAPQDDATEVAGQLIHWLFAMGDTLPANLFRSMAVLATHDRALDEVRGEFKGTEPTDPKVIGDAKFTAGCLLEAMRLWPTTSLFGRVLTEETRFPNGVKVPEGTQVLIHNLFNHRNRERLTYADLFNPNAWAVGKAGEDWSFNFFSHGPQGCPGAGMAIFLGTAFLARLVTTGGLIIDEGVRLNPDKPLPYALDIYGLKIAFA